MEDESVPGPRRDMLDPRKKLCPGGIIASDRPADKCVPSVDALPGFLRPNSPQAGPSPSSSLQTLPEAEHKFLSTQEIRRVGLTLSR